MRIIYFLGGFPITSETFILNQINGMIRRGHVVDIYARKRFEITAKHPEAALYGLPERVRYPPEVPENYLARVVGGCHLLGSRIKATQPAVVLRALNVRKYRRQAASLRLLYTAIPLLPQERYDVIHAQFGALGLLALAMMQIGAVEGKLVTSFRGSDATRYLMERPHVYDELFREGDLFLPVSHDLEKRIVDAGCRKEKTFVLHSGIDCGMFTYLERRPPPDGVVHFLSVGRLVEKKGVEYAIRAVAEICSPERKVLYSIIGDGEKRHELKQLARDLGLGDTVRFLGWKSHDQVLHLMNKAHVLIAPSVTAADGNKEGIPNSLKEAMASGMPVVGTRHGGIPELVQDGRSGFIVPEGDVGSLARCLAWCADHPESWPEMGRAGRREVERHFDIHKLNDELERLYEAALTA